MQIINHYINGTVLEGDSCKTSDVYNPATGEVSAKVCLANSNETKKAIAPALIHEEGNLLRRVVRDIYSKEMKEILVQGNDAYK